MEWIAVTQNVFPAENSEILICFHNSAGKHIELAKFIDFAFYYEAETDKGYYKEQFGFVTHWMPLPQLPNN